MNDYGDDSIPTSYAAGSDEPIIIQLEQSGKTRKRDAKELLAQLEALEPGLRNKIIAEKKATLTKPQLDALAILLKNAPSKRANSP